MSIIETDFKISNTDFNISDIVVYPQHGVGEITSLEKSSMYGKEEDVYKIKFFKTKLTVFLPLRNLDEVGLRNVSSSDCLDAAIITLKKNVAVRRDYLSKSGVKNRTKSYEKKINSGDLKKIAEVIRDLKVKCAASSSYSEKMFYQEACDRFAEELSVIRSIALEDAKNYLSEVIG